MTEPNVSDPNADLPPPELRMVMTDNLDPDRGSQKGEAISWIVGSPHPFMPSMTIEAMFVSRGAVAVYIYSSGKGLGARDVIPMQRVRLAHERMHPEVLAEEINASAAGEDPYVYVDPVNDPDGDLDDALDSTPAAEPTPPNGQPSP